MPPPIIIITNGVFPVAFLPYRLLATVVASYRHASSQVMLDQAQAQCIIRIAFRQAHQQMQMIGQNDNGIEFEGISVADPPESLTQAGNMARIGEPGIAVIGYQREEETTARNDGTTVLAHVTVPVITVGTGILSRLGGDFKSPAGSAAVRLDPAYR